MIDTCRCGFCGAILPNLAEAAQARNAELEAKVGELEAALQSIAHQAVADMLNRILESAKTMTRPMLIDWLEREQADLDSPAPDQVVDANKVMAQQAVVDAAMDWRFEGGPVSALEQALIDLRETGGE